MAFEAPIWSLMAVGKLHILWPHLDSDLFTKITIFLVRFFVLTVGYYEASEGQPVLGLTVLGPLLDSRTDVYGGHNWERKVCHRYALNVHPRVPALREHSS